MNGLQDYHRTLMSSEVGEACHTEISLVYGGPTQICSLYISLGDPGILGQAWGWRYLGQTRQSWLTMTTWSLWICFIVNTSTTAWTYRPPPPGTGPRAPIRRPSPRGCCQLDLLLPSGPVNSSGSSFSEVLCLPSLHPIWNRGCDSS